MEFMDSVFRGVLLNQVSIPSSVPGAVTAPELMNLTSIWSGPAAGVMVRWTWVSGSAEQPALFCETGCTMVGTG
ncbi:hypothetical protein V1J52_24395 [Streptomyces sp. TRM 70351]|uniref:hypothetical protein n=1 Tax=Streptomyces sp. TRM 70351 TaxID=3116552 RepID=UPI002E7B8471|nr:hypothetical protein [Streptomyces sp. TRM 70351]MEE1931277.1 hypothetical protein [Streptomyces sp. TRM 70351]